MCNVASCWIYIGILLAHLILHISRIRVKQLLKTSAQVYLKNRKGRKNLIDPDADWRITFKWIVKKLNVWDGVK
jgi:hypothetical protein